jgi:hypothetical protein
MDTHYLLDIFHAMKFDKSGVTSMEYVLEKSRNLHDSILARTFPS